MIHRINVFLVCLFVALNPIFLINSANASTVGGWSLSNPLAKGASTLYNGAKNVIINGKNVAKTSTALITPTATGVAKVLVRGVAGVALSFAVEQIIGADYSWWIEGNLIKYRIPADPNNVPQCWRNSGVGCFATPDAAAKAYLLYDNTLRPSNKSVRFEKIINDTSLTVYLYDKDDVLKGLSTFTYVNNPAYNPEASSEDEVKSLPIETVAQKVIDNAEGGNADAQVATTAAVSDIVNDAQKDDAKARPIVNQLEANSKTETDVDSNTATGEAKPNTETGGTDLALEFPTFCGWAPQVCEAAQTVISFPTTLTDWWNTANSKADSWAQSISQAWATAKDWATTNKDTNNDNTEVEIQPDTVPDLRTDIFKASGECPSDFTYPFPLPLGGTYTISYSYETACYWFSKLYFVVVLIASIIGLKIVTGVDGNKDG